MANEHKPTVSELFDDGTAIAQAMDAAVREAVLQHKHKGLPLAVWRDGKVAWIPAEDVEAVSDTPSAPTRVARP
jgi:hypothetical protein